MPTYAYSLYKIKNKQIKKLLNISNFKIRWILHKLPKYQTVSETLSVKSYGVPFVLKS